MKSRYLISATVLFFAFTCAVGAYSVYQIKQVHAEVESTRSFYIPALKQLGYLTGKWSAYLRSYEKSISFRKWGEKQAAFPDMKIRLKNLIEGNLKVLEKQLEQTQSNENIKPVEVAKLRELVLFLRQVSDQESSRVFETSGFLKTGDYKRAAASYSETRALHQQVSQKTQSLVRALEDSLSEVQFHLNDRLRNAHFLMLYVLVSSVLCCALGLFKVRKWLLPVFELTKVSEQIALSGWNRELKFPEIKKGMLAEVSNLIRQFSRMAMTLKEREKTIQEQSERQSAQNAVLKRLGDLNEKVIQSMGSGLLIVNAQNTVEGVNQSFCEAFGRKAAECVDKNISELLDLKIQLEPGFYSAIELIDHRFFDIRVNRIGTQSSMQGHLIVLDEVTRLKEAQEKLEHLKKLGLAGDLSAQVAHELRNPLHSMGLHLEMLKEDLDEVSPLSTRSEIEKRADILLDQVNRLDRITQKYLDMKFKPKSVGDNQQSFSLSKLLEKCLDFFASDFEKEKIKCEKKIDPSLFLTRRDLVFGDADRVSQVFFNLIRNALDSLVASNQTIPKKITVSVQQAGSKIQVCIEDNGPGITSQVRERLFEPFITSKPAGNGMGLCVSRQICIEHAGDLIVAQSKSHATAFTVTLPVERNHAQYSYRG